MRIVLVGADFEENLALGVLAAVAEGAGHSVRIVPFNQIDQVPQLAALIARERPAVVGLSIQFQHRAHEFLALARSLRRAGFRGHVTAGGQFPTLAYQEVLERGHGIDSVVLHEGEQTFVELLAALDRGASTADLALVPGLALKTNDGVVLRTAPRPLLADLDRAPFPRRYRPHSRHAGVPFIPIMGGRGCWGSCSYCSITSFYRDAKHRGGGRLLRARSPKNVAEEIALLWHAARGSGIFCFHDDNFLLPRPEDSLERIRAIRAELDALGVGKLAIIGKCRPETLTPELAKSIKELGVIRLYVGIENASAEGACHLGRERQHAAIHDALEACRSAGIFVCYNLLVFEPDTTLDDVRANVAFIRAHAASPVNFCRAEPYHGTPLHASLAASGRLGGSYLGWDYRIADDRAELLFRIAAAAFRERNFASDGVANRMMGLGYMASVVDHFHAGPDGDSARMRERAAKLTRSITLDTADLLERAIEIAERAGLGDPAARDRVERMTVELGLEISEADRKWQLAMDELYDDMDAYARKRMSLRPKAEEPAPPPRLLQLARALAIGVSLAAWGTGTAGCAEESVVDPLPPDMGRADAMVADPPPPDAGRRDATVADPPPPDAGVVDAGRPDVLVADPPPPDAGRADAMVADPPPPDAGRADAMVADPPPPDAGRADAGHEDVTLADPAPMDAGFEGADAESRDIRGPVDPPPPDAGRDDIRGPVDPPPPDAGRDDVRGPVDPPPPDAGLDAGPLGALEKPGDLPLLSHWRDSTPKRAARSEDLPLFAPPDVRLDATREGDRIRVRVAGLDGAASTRWESDGKIAEVRGDWRSGVTEVLWAPADGRDQLRVAVRSRGGVAVVSLRAKTVA